MVPSMANPLDMLLQVGCYSDTRCYACQTEKMILTHNEQRFECQTLISKKNVTTPLCHKSQKKSYIMICYANLRVADPVIYFILILHLLKDL